MAICIRTELDRINQITTAIQSMAKGSLDQAFPADQPPHWAITLELLSDLAMTELEGLHNRLVFATEQH